MKVYIDGQEYLALPSDADAPSVWEGVSSHVSRTGRVVTQIELDGVAMDAEAFSGVSGGFQVSFSTQPVRVLVQETLDEALKYIPRLAGGLEEIASHFEGNELALGQRKLADAAEGLDWLLTVFQNCSGLLAIAPDEEKSGLKDLKEALGQSIERLSALHGEKKHLQMALCIRQRLLSELDRFSIYVQQLRDLSSSVQ